MVERSVEEDIEALKTATREAHETLQMCRDVIREMKRLQATFREELDTAMDIRVAEVVRAGLISYGATIHEAIDKSTAEVFKRFDTIYQMLVGNNKKLKRKHGLQGLIDVIEEIDPEQAVQLGATLGSGSELSEEPTRDHRQQGEESSTADNGGG